LKKNQKRISTAIPHAKPIAVKKCQLYVSPCHLNPMARMPIKHHYSFNQQLSAGGTVGRNQTEENWNCFPKK
jgi:hypothetical protein